MAKIKYTKSELKTQRQNLERFRRYLPTLQLKKQQLQSELRRVESLLDETLAEERELEREMEDWVGLFGTDFDFTPFIDVLEVKSRQDNVVGVEVDEFEEVVFAEPELDLLKTPAWVDKGIRALRRAIRSRISQCFLKEQLKRLAAEHRVTNQRVNLFEKIRIPQTLENIRAIQIFLGDQQTAAVVRAKIAKQKTAEV